MVGGWSSEMGKKGNNMDPMARSRILYTWKGAEQKTSQSGTRDNNGTSLRIQLQYTTMSAPSVTVVLLVWFTIY